MAFFTSMYTIKYGDSSKDIFNRIDFKEIKKSIFKKTFAYKISQDDRRISLLAAFYGVNTKEILKLNPKIDAKKLRNGQIIRIPKVDWQTLYLKLKNV